MDFFEAVKSRRSCRKYLAESVPQEVIHRALDAALLAPNSSNMQLTEFYWVRSPEKKHRLVEACLGQPAASTAPELIVCAANWKNLDRNRRLIIAELSRNPKMPKRAFDYYQYLMPIAYRWGFFNWLGWLKKILTFIIGIFRPITRGSAFRSEVFETMSKSAALACENFMLAISAQGYDTCPMEGFDEWRVKRILGLGCNSTIVMVISVGKRDPAGIWGDRFRIPRDLAVFEV